jgi:vancomycin resistance protein VanW
MDGEGVRRVARNVAGPAVRRARRELQWRTCRADLALAVASLDGHGYPVADHATPLLRPLPGLDPALQRNKVVNLRLAVARLDGRLLRPGQRFSFWKQVGPPSARRGYLDGLVLDDGRLTAGVGGGLCQLTNLIYWMTVHTPLTVVERWRHSYDVFPDSGRTQPFGSGATCAWPSLDLQLENRTTTSYRLGLRVTDTHLVGAWTASSRVLTGYHVYEAAHVMTNDAPGVFSRHNVLRRRVLDLHGRALDDELVAENHARLMYQPFLPAGSRTA